MNKSDKPKSAPTRYLAQDPPGSAGYPRAAGTATRELHRRVSLLTGFITSYPYRDPTSEPIEEKAFMEICMAWSVLGLALLEEGK